jgi:hypothetical protein
MDKRGLELSINFIVVMILAVITLFMGIVIFRIMFAGGTEFEQQVSDKTKAEINSILMRGEDEVVLPDFYRQMSVGDTHAFALGIRNNGPDSEFTVLVEPKSWAINDTNQQAGPVDVRGWYFGKLGPFTVKSSSLEVVSVPMRVTSTGKKGWTYVFNVTVVDKQGSTYGTLQKIYIEVR